MGLSQTIQTMVFQWVVVADISCHKAVEEETKNELALLRAHLQVAPRALQNRGCPRAHWRVA